MKPHHFRVDNRTRALITEFSTYNAQVNLFCIVTCVAEVVGGGIQPYFRIDAIRLFANQDGFGIVTMIAQALFVFSTFYYIVDVIMAIKREGCNGFFSNSWNVIDLATVFFSVFSMILFVVRLLMTNSMTSAFDESQGNRYIRYIRSEIKGSLVETSFIFRLTKVALVNEWFTVIISFTVFTSSLKFCKLLSFHRAFMQIAATIKLCFIGLSSFVIEFGIVFCAFTAFFYFSIKNNLENFRDFPRSLANTFAMSIGKFNFSAIREADVLAAWIFFIFSGTVKK